MIVLSNLAEEIAAVPATISRLDPKLEWGAIDLDNARHVVFARAKIRRVHASLLEIRRRGSNPLAPPPKLRRMKRADALGANVDQGVRVEVPQLLKTNDPRVAAGVTSAGIALAVGVNELGGNGDGSVRDGRPRAVGVAQRDGAAAGRCDLHARQDVASHAAGALQVSDAVDGALTLVSLRLHPGVRGTVRVAERLQLEDRVQRLGTSQQHEGCGSGGRKLYRAR